MKLGGWGKRRGGRRERRIEREGHLRMYVHTYCTVLHTYTVFICNYVVLLNH